MLAAAQGRRRSDVIEDLAGLRFAVRVDQSGSLLRDYQTAQNWQQKNNPDTKLVTRYFLSDAAFVAAVESEDRQFIDTLREALTRPVYPVFLGRRSCPAPPNLVLGVVDTNAVKALQDYKTWHATKDHMRNCGEKVLLPIYRDGLPGEEGQTSQDVPISFDPQHRKYGWRTVVQKEFVQVSNPLDKNQLRRDPFMEAVMNV